jgi:glycosyltransferase involved in cell wall biosynthesis
MKVVHLTSVHPRYDTRIFHKQLVSLLKSGYEVELIVNDSLPNETIRGISIISTGKTFHNKFSRIIYSTFAFPVHALRRKADLYHIHDPELMPVGIFLRVMRKKVIYDVHEDYAMILSSKSPKWLGRILANTYLLVEYLTVRLVSGVLVVNETLFNKHKKIAKNISIVANFPLIQELYTKVGFQGRKLKLIFAGGLTKEWELKLLVETIGERNDCELLIAGKETEYFKSLDIVSKSNVTYLGHLDKARLSEYYKESHIGLALSSSVQLQNEGSIGNTKVFEYMSFGLPVIVNNNQTWLDIIERHHLGIVLSTNNKSELNQAINNIISEPNEWIKMRDKSFELSLSSYNWTSEYSKLEQVYKQIFLVSKTK